MRAGWGLRDGLSTDAVERPRWYDDAISIDEHAFYDHHETRPGKYTWPKCHRPNEYDVPWCDGR
jgi:hypothetical protein